MDINNALKEFNEYKEKCAAYSLLLSTAYFDKETIAPLAGNDYRNKQFAYLSGETYLIQNDPRIIEIVEYLSKQDLGTETNREVYLYKKDLERISKFTKEEIVAFDQAKLEGFDKWYEAKINDDYSLFSPSLSKLIELSKFVANRRDPNKPAYDVLLDDYQDGMSMKEYDHFFELIKKELLPLIKEVNNRQSEVDDSFLYLDYPIERQKKFTPILLDYLGFDKRWGYIGEAEHPFTMALSVNDVRITTHYYQNNIASSIFSIIHECGHAYYEHQVNEKYQGSMLASCISSGMHESQSRFLENYIGKLASFWSSLYPKLQELFPENLGNISLEKFVRALNASRSSLIRTDADELTYPIHILIRYEIEKSIFSKEIATDNLDKIWDEKYQEYLGIHSSNCRDGILQDVHWSDGSFGYFPTYALGSAIGAQLFAHMKEEIDVDGYLANGQFNKIEEYLKDNLQSYGALYDFHELLIKATGEDFNPKYYIDYLKDKYSKLYNI